MQLALAALHRSNEVHRVVNFERFKPFSGKSLAKKKCHLSFSFNKTCFCPISGLLTPSYMTCLNNCRYLESIFSRQRSSHSISQLNESMKIIDFMVIFISLMNQLDCCLLAMVHGSHECLYYIIRHDV